MAQFRTSTVKVGFDASDVLTPDAVLPSQFSALRKRTPDEPERRLLFAVLDDAIRTWTGRGVYNGVHGRSWWLTQAKEAEAWLFLDDSGAAVSVEWTCEVLGIDLGWLRKGLRAMQDASAELPGRPGRVHYPGRLRGENRPNRAVSTERRS
jgi:hypothetical protein